MDWRAKVELFEGIRREYEFPESEGVHEQPATRVRGGKLPLADRFEEALACCKDEAGCLDNLIWEELDEREKTARLLTEMGYQSKATRYHDCHVMGVPVDCLACGER